MNYIGSKLKLSSFLKDTVIKTVGNIDDKIFCDIFAGTGIVTGMSVNNSMDAIISRTVTFQGTGALTIGTV